MNRCADSLSPTPPPRQWRLGIAVVVIALAASALTPLAASAQSLAAQNGVRNFPPKALRGKLVVTASPEITMDGKADRLSPGARIRDTQNMLVMPAAITGRELVVNYVRETHGLVHEVWVLTEAEAKEKRPGATAERNFSFSSDPPKTDTTSVPFDQLPKYKY